MMAILESLLPNPFHLSSDRNNVGSSLIPDIAIWVRQGVTAVVNLTQNMHRAPPGLPDNDFVCRKVHEHSVGLHKMHGGLY